MKKFDLGQAIKIFANVGVLVGILLLVYELNQNRQMMQAQTRNAIAETLVDMLYQRASSPELAELRAKQEAREPLTAAEELQYQDLQGADWRYRENVSYQYRIGLYEVDEYLAQREMWRDLLNSDEAIRAYWCGRNTAATPAEFLAEINDLLEQPCE